ncbi:MAG: hypothetical protein ABEI97_05290, partial [Candidatus Nanohaloarchaea archaeon]
MEEEINISHSTLILVLDACRYDTFQKAYNGAFPGDLQKAYSPANWTIPSHSSIIRGQLPAPAEDDEIFDNEYKYDIYPLPLQHSHSFGVVAMSMLADFPFLETGVPEYFDDWTDYYEEASAGTVAMDAAAMLEKAEQHDDFFGLVNFRETHHPYNLERSIPLHDIVEELEDGETTPEELQKAQIRGAETVIQEIQGLRDSIPEGTK